MKNKLHIQNKLYSYLVDTKIKNVIPFTITQKVKYCGVNLIKQVQNFFAEKH